MGSALSTIKQRKMRRELRKKIFCVQKHRIGNVLPDIPEKCRLLMMKELSVELRSLYRNDETNNNYQNQLHRVPSGEGDRIPASKMVIMKNLRRELQDFSKADLTAKNCCWSMHVDRSCPPWSSWENVLVLKDIGKVITISTSIKLNCVT